jgi:hypothetical protein
MGSFFQNVWYGASDLLTQTWQWFNNLDREEWMIVLIIVCVCGFASLRGFSSRRI